MEDNDWPPDKIDNERAYVTLYLIDFIEMVARMMEDDTIRTECLTIEEILRLRDERERD